MPQPFEMISGPLTVYTAPEGTSFPEISATPPSPWGLLGTNGDRSISDDGLSVNFEEEMNGQMALGSTAIQKLFRVSEEITFDFSLLDVTAETFAIAMSGLSVSQVPAGVGSAGYRSVPLLRGFNVSNLAFLMRGKSPYQDDTMFAQFWVPKGYASFNGELQYQKGEAAMITISLMVLEYGSNGYGEYQTQDALPA